MRKFEDTGMEREALHRVGPRSVFFVADDRTSGVCPRSVRLFRVNTAK